MFRFVGVASPNTRQLNNTESVVAIVLVTLKIGVLFLLAWNRRFVMDEFVQFGWAKYLTDDLFNTNWPAKAVGFAVFYDAGHLIGRDARSMLLIGRMQTAMLTCVMLVMIFGCARSLGESRLRALGIVLVLLGFSNFIERIFETRAEPLATFFGVAALLVLVRGGGDLRRRRIIAAGVLAGLAFLSTQKAIYFDVALGLALVGDRVIGRHHRDGIARGALLVLGWLLPIVIYCVLFGRGDPLPVARNLFFGPVGAASPHIADEYGGLRHYVAQTLLLNFLLYLLSFCGMILALLRVRSLEPARRVALIFSIVVTVLVFTHNQPWPYVFVMALPFIALWSIWPIEALSGQRHYLIAVQAVLAVAICASFVRNIQVLRVDNHKQLELVSRAEALLGPRDVYFDGIGMLPDRFEPSGLWLDWHAILLTRRAGRQSELYRIFTRNSPKLIIWSYRMDAVEPLVGRIIRGSYVRISPNIRIAGIRLQNGKASKFDAPLAGRYALYGQSGAPVAADLEVAGKRVSLPVELPRGPQTVTLTGAGDAFLLPDWNYRGKIDAAPDDRALFADVYN